MAAFVNRICIFDSETTSNKPLEDDIISLGAVITQYDHVQRKFVKEGEFHCYVDTNKPIDPIAFQIHHISKSDLCGQPKFPQALELFKTFLIEHQPEPNSRLILLAHNGKKFDELILYANCVQHKLDFDQFLKSIHCYGFVDSLDLLKSLFKTCSYKDQPKNISTGRVSYALGHCFSSFCGGNLEGAHDALADCLGLLEVLNSPCVSSKVNLQNFFNMVTPRDKGVKRIKQSAGIAFQNKEETTRQAQIQIDDIKVPTKVSVEPIFEECANAQQNEVRLCLNCMTFCKMNQHERCDGKTESLSKYYAARGDTVVDFDAIETPNDISFD